MDFKGTYTALVTPFLDDAERTIDWEAFDALVDAQIEGGVEGIVPCGTTGESPALSHEEQEAVIRRSVERARGRVQVVAGTGSNSTRAAVDSAKAAVRAGADAVMSVVPYYNRPTQEGLEQHFVAVAAAVGARVPVVVYNVPARTGVDLAADTLARICAAAPNVVATKEATGAVLRAQELSRKLGNRLTILSGDDALTLPMIAVGARGVISVTSNVLPRAVARATTAALEGSREDAMAKHLELLRVHEAMFIEANPGPVKAALAMRGKCKDALRLPLVSVKETTRKALAAALEGFA